MASVLHDLLLDDVVSLISSHPHVVLSQTNPQKPEMKTNSRMERRTSLQPISSNLTHLGIQSPQVSNPLTASAPPATIITLYAILNHSLNDLKKVVPDICHGFNPYIPLFWPYVDNWIEMVHQRYFQ